MIALVVGHKLATLHELRTVYTTSDMWDLYEIALVDAHNRKVANKVDSLMQEAKRREQA